MAVNNVIQTEYFKWLCQLVNDGRSVKQLHYNKLLEKLYNVEFNYIMPMDGNRAEDGVDLRYRFGHSMSYNDAVISSCLDNIPCSVLEMMAALAIRCEEHIMDNLENENRTGQWFWNMISNLGLDDMNDVKFNEECVNNILSSFLNRDYKANGSGGLFMLENCAKDLRTVEIWYQMCWYLDNVMKMGSSLIR